MQPAFISHLRNFRQHFAADFGDLVDFRQGVPLPPIS
jgi:hypothetical protein